MDRCAAEDDVTLGERSLTVVVAGAGVGDRGAPPLDRGLGAVGTGVVLGKDGLTRRHAPVRPEVEENRAAGIQADVVGDRGDRRDGVGGRGVTGQDRLDVVQGGGIAHDQGGRAAANMVGTLNSGTENEVGIGDSGSGAEARQGNVYLVGEGQDTRHPVRGPDGEGRRRESTASRAVVHEEGIVPTRHGAEVIPEVSPVKEVQATAEGQVSRHADDIIQKRPCDRGRGLAATQMEGRHGGGTQGEIPGNLDAIDVSLTGGGNRTAGREIPEDGHRGIGVGGHHGSVTGEGLIGAEGDAATSLLGNVQDAGNRCRRSSYRIAKEYICCRGNGGIGAKNDSVI